MFRTIRKKLFRLAVVSGAGAAANYFFDRDRGEQRRTQLKEKANGIMGKAGGGGSWQPQAEHTANGFEPSVVAPTVPTAPAPAPPAPPVSDVIVEPAPDDTIVGPAPTTTPLP
jgi:hypothetical protein